MDSFCPSHLRVFEELQELAPDAPFLALGQTAFWDEPMKAGVALCSRELGFDRGFVAGIHDTDYFAKHGVGKVGFEAQPHNDTSTKDLWSAAGEFSSLFGSETVVTRETLLSAGTRVGKIQRERPRLLDEITEAYGWRGVVMTTDHVPVVAEVSAAQASKALLDTFQWAIDQTLDALPKCRRTEAVERAEDLKRLACNVISAPGVKTVSDFYREILSHMYPWVAGEPVHMETTATTQLLKFNRQTADLPRFEIVELFLRDRERAVTAYDKAVSSTEIYTLDRFGSWAMPFDLVVPGKGRGTLRVTPHAVMVMLSTPICISLEEPIHSVRELAEAIEDRLGPDCVLVGKAVSLISMLAREFVFVFHQGASAYVRTTRAFHQALNYDVNPILRVGYSTWDTIQHCDLWLRLPEPLRGPFGAAEISSRSFSERWRSVGEEQQALLSELSQLRRPLDLIRFLSSRFSQSWGRLAVQYEDVHGKLQVLHDEVATLKAQKQRVLTELRAAKQSLAESQRQMGEHWREKLFEKVASPEDWDERRRLTQTAQDWLERTRDLRRKWEALQEQQRLRVESEEVVRAHEERQTLELEIEIARANLVREAVISMKGLEKSGLRPSAWWFPLMCPDGGWFSATTRTAQYSLEPLK